MDFKEYVGWIHIAHHRKEWINFVQHFSTPPWGLRVPLFSVFFFLIWRNIPHWVRASSFTRFLDHTQRRTTVGRTSLNEWPARRWDLYLTTHNTHNRQISMLPVGFEPTISTGQRPQTYALDRAASGTGPFILTHWGRVTQICVFNTRLFSLHNTLKL